MTTDQTTIQDSAERDYFVAQFKALIKRHPVEDVILVRVLADHYQLAAKAAKLGEIGEAKRILAALGRDVDLPPDDEIGQAVRFAELPARALVHWLEGETVEALDLLRGGLESGGRLASAYEHDYLTSKRIYIGANVARVLVATDDVADASRLVDSLVDVAAGDRGRWPFGEPDSLDVPLQGRQQAVIAWHLDRVRSHVPPSMATSP